ncbi:MAG: COG1361 S-layer family protein, partial [Nitrosopumilaceae archaeon]
MIYKTIAIAIIFLLGQIIIPSYASAPEHIAPGVSPFEHTFNDIKFLDAYFGTSSGKIEVQPGDKNVPFTIVFSNVGSEDIAGIKGLLSLPVGFSPAIANANANLIEADNTQVATSGSSFFLTFFVNVDKNTSVNSYTGTVQVTYSRVRENGVHTNYFDFDFKVPGKSVLNMKAENQFIQPASNNQITVQVLNDGTAGLNNVDITLNTQSNSTMGSSNLQNVVIDQNHWNIGTVAAQSSSTFSFNIFVPQDVTGQTLHIPLGITYFDGQGNQITTSRLVDLIVGPASSTFVVRLSTPSYLMMGVMQNLTLGLENLSPSKISDISITLVPSSSGIKILQDPRWFVNDINPLEKTALNIPVFADQSISNQAVNFDANIQYTKDGST